MAYRDCKNKSASICLRLAAPLILLMCYGRLAAFPDLRTAIPEMLAVTALVTIFLAFTVFVGEKTTVPCSPVVILVLAAIFRLLFLFSPPQLSDDVYRYLFDGTRLLEGHNPYATTPESVLTQNVPGADVATKVNHPHLVTIYPPAAQLIFVAGGLLDGLTRLKTVLISIDILLIALLLRLAAALNISRWRVIFYAWHPLPILEIASSGHIDGAGLTALFAAIWLMFRATTFSNPVLPSDGPLQRPKPMFVFFAGVLFSIAVWIKLFPIVYLPLVFRLLRRRQYAVFSFGMTAGSLLLIIPFCPGIVNIFKTLHIYGARWEFSGLLFRTLRNWGVTGFWARSILIFCFLVLLLYSYRMSGVDHPTKMSREPVLIRVLSAHFVIGVGFLLFTPTLHPWYGLYMLAFLPFSPGAAGLILSWSITLGYRILISHAILGQWVENDVIPFLIWVGPAVAFLLLLLCQRISLPMKHKGDGPGGSCRRIFPV